MEHGLLHVGGQAGAQALDVHLLGGPALGLNKELVPVLVGEFHHLVLDGGAVAGARGVDATRVQGGPVQVVQDDPVGVQIRIGEPAPILDQMQFPVEEGEGGGGLVPLLDRHLSKIQGVPLHPGRGAGLEAPQGDAESRQVPGQTLAPKHARGAALPDEGADEDAALQIHPRAQDRRPAGVAEALRRDHARDTATLGGDIHGLALDQGQVFFPFQGPLHALVVAALVHLGPEGVDRGALARVQHAHLDQGVVGGQAHLPAHGVQLPDQVALAGTADGGVAGHHADAVQVQGEQSRLEAHPHRGQGRLAAPVPGADHHAVEALPHEGLDCPFVSHTRILLCIAV